MLLQDLMPMTAPMTIARTQEEASAAIQVHTDKTLLGLVDGPRFASLDLLRDALREISINLECSSYFRGAKTHYRATATGFEGKPYEGWKYSMILKEVSGLIYVDDAIIVKFGVGHDPELAKAYKALLEEKE